VAARDWATWHPIIRPERCHVSAPDSPTSLPRVSATSLPYATSSLPRHLTRKPATSSPYDADVIRATCHPPSGDTCHSRIGPTTRRKRQKCLTRVTSGAATCPVRTCHVSSPDAATSLYGRRHVSLYGLTRVCTDCTDRYSQHPKFCLFGSADRMRYLPHTDSVCDKNYTTGIRKTSRTSWCWFRRIPSTFIFEHFSCPDGSWIRFLIIHMCPRAMTFKFHATPVPDMLWDRRSCDLDDLV
jgi:hypothetical protein